MPKGYSVIITDTSCFSLLQKLDALDLLHQLFPVVITTPQIASEFRYPLPDWVIIRPVANVALQNEFLNFVDYGEASAIALASEITFDFLIIDDGHARKFAEKLGMLVKGTIGLLVIAKSKGLIPALRPYFEQIQQTNFRIAKSLIDSVLREAGE